MKLITSNQLRKRVHSEVSDDVLTEQHYKPLCDIENIVETYRKTGHLPNIVQKVPRYVDNTLQPTFEEMHDQIQQTKELYNQLPTRIKNATNNDYRKFESWINNPENINEAEKFGLISVKKKQTKNEPPAPAAPQKAEPDKPE